jgi:hypothetical protein
MKKSLLTISSMLLMTLTQFGCNKANDCGDARVPVSSSVSSTITSKAVLTGTQALIRQWMEWAFTRDVSLAPWDDATGARQYLNQPNSSGTMLLAGGASPALVNRQLTISLAQYQEVFIPIVNSFVYWNDCYPGPPYNTVPTGELVAALSEGLNGKRDITLNWDGVSLLPAKLKNLRENSGFWIVPVHPSWDGGCVASSTTAYADGFWAKVPLTTGVHTLEVAGDSDYRQYKSAFSNHVMYTITVTN